MRLWQRFSWRWWWRRIDSACCLFALSDAWCLTFDCAWCGRRYVLPSVVIRVESRPVQPPTASWMALHKRLLTEFVGRPNTPETREELQRWIERELPALLQGRRS